MEYGNHRVQVFDKNGRFLFKFGSKGNGNGQLNYPQGITVDQRNNQIVVADTYNYRIQIFDEKGNFLRSFGSNGNGVGQFNLPVGVVVHQSNGNYLVTDPGIIEFKSSIQKDNLFENLDRMEMEMKMVN